MYNYSPDFDHVRIGKIIFPGGTDENLPKRLTVQMNPACNAATTSLIGRNVLTTNTTWSFCWTSPQDFILIIISEEQKNGILNELSRLTLPINWFSQNQVVRFAFPMTTNAPEDEKPMAYLDIHVSSTNCVPFAAKLGPLLVTPTWNVPNEGLSGYYVPPQQQTREPNYTPINH